jgi:hypothetical protein
LLQETEQHSGRGSSPTRGMAACRARLVWQMGRRA